MKKPSSRFAPLASLAVIVPTLNEHARLSACLDSINQAARDMPFPVDIVAADAGSTDDTAVIAASYGARVVTSARGRGIQIRAGIEACRADCLLVLHADCRLKPDALANIMAALNSRLDACGGALGLSFEPDFRLSRLAGRLSSLKTRLSGISFGDQGQFVRREALGLIGGFPAMELMEDVELSLKLRQAGTTIFLGTGVLAASRAFGEWGFWGNYRRMLPLIAGYLVRRFLGLPIDPKAYYRRYYRS